MRALWSPAARPRTTYWWRTPDDPRVVKEIHVTMYHLLWELVHVFLEQPGTLSPGVFA